MFVIGIGVESGNWLVVSFWSLSGFYVGFVVS